MPAKASVRWNGRAVYAKVVAEVERRMHVACIFVVGETKRALNRSQPVVRRGKRLIGLDPSKPGEPPKKVTGRLQMSIVYKVVRTSKSIVGYVGSDVVYARALEFGHTYKYFVLLPRPYVRPAIANHGNQIAAILRTGAP